MDIFNNYIEPVIQWLHYNPHWAGIITFLISFSESLAIVGTIVPGSLTMTAVGVLIGSGVIPFYSTFLWAILGAVAGDSASYFLGYYYHVEIAEYWPFRKYPNIITKGKTFFILHGGKSVFLGRFLGPLRSIIPVIAGMMRMPNSRFLCANVTSAVLWSLLYIVPGILIGAATSELSAETAGKLFFFLFIGLLVVWIATWIIKAILTLIKRFSVRHLNQFWQWMRAHPKFQTAARWIAEPDKPHDLTQVYFTLLSFLCLICFVIVAISAKHHGFVTRYNAASFHLLESIRFPILDKLFTAVTFFGDKLVLLPLSLIVTSYLYFSRHKWSALHLLSVTFFTALFIKLTKHWVHFERPTGLIEIRHGFSFPSGHTAISLSVIGFITFLLSKQTTLSMKRFIWFPVIGYFILVTLSRLYLGAHWISDVLGAYFFVGFILFIHIVSYQRKLSPLISIPKLSTLTLSVLLTGGLLLNAFCFTNTLKNSQLLKTIKPIPLSLWWNSNSNIFPLYRNNRLGTPINLLNLQWGSKLEVIENSLLQAGWSDENNISIQYILGNLVTKKAINRLPILNPLYRNQRPALTMTYKIKNEPLIILNLWPSLYQFKKVPFPLFIGSVYQRINTRTHYDLLNKLQIRNVEIKKPEKLFSTILSQFIWKTLKVNRSDSTILLVKPGEKKFK